MKLSLFVIVSLLAFFWSRYAWRYSECFIYIVKAIRNTFPKKKSNYLASITIASEDSIGFDLEDVRVEKEILQVQIGSQITLFIHIQDGTTYIQCICGYVSKAGVGDVFSQYDTQSLIRIIGEARKKFSAGVKSAWEISTKIIYWGELKSDRRC